MEHQTKLNDDKLAAVAKLKADFSVARDFVFTDYRGLTVQQITQLRTKLRDKSAVYHVVKNNYAKIAFDQLNAPDVSPYLVGPTAIASTDAESGPIVKDLLDMAKEWPVTVKGGLVGGSVFDAEQMVAYSKLPTKLELISMLMSAMNGPVRNVMYAMNGVASKLVRTLQAVADQKAEAN